MLTNLAPFAVGGALHAMTQYKQWLLFQRTEWDTVKRKWGKKPIQANGYPMPWRAAPEKLMTFEAAVAALARYPDACIGFVLTEADPFFCLDVDDCAVYGADGVQTGWTKEALELVNSIPNGVVEVSMSGNGLHVFGSGAIGLHACDNDTLHAEFYTKHRAMALTGNVAVGTNHLGLDSTLAANALVDAHFVRKQRDVKRNGEGANIEDLEKAAEAIKFIDPLLNYNDWLGVCMALHAAGVEADAEELAYTIAQAYTEQSPKYVPGYLDYKWGSFHADGGLTLGTLFHHAKAGGYKTREEIDAAEAFKAHQVVEAIDASNLPPPPPSVETAEVKVEEHKQGILYPNDYISMFGGCVYIASLHSIWAPDGQVHDQKRFDAHYSGHQYALDMEARKCTDSPWEAFFKCRVYKFKRVRTSCFRPELPTGMILSHEGKTMVNIYHPVPIARRAGDVTPFLAHLAKILPDERDRRILLTYMAAMVQNPGVKFRWAPLLQGDEGNGKTFFTHCLENAVGQTYTHYPQAQDLDNKFNAWLVNKLLIAVEDVYVPGHKANIIEVLKPMITGERGPIQGKGADQVTMNVCANFIFNSNHRNALGAAVKGRRYCVFYAAQQEKADLLRDGLTGRYFRSLYNWAKSGGFACVTEYLHTYKLDEEFNPAGECTTAPYTSSHSEVLAEALGPIEQEILAAVTDERAGFVAPWISSQAVDKLLRETGNDRKVPRNKRRQLVESLGYVRHPHLLDGRTNNAVLPDGGRTTLFVKFGHPALELQGPALIAERYTKTQNDAIKCAMTLAAGVDIK